MRILLAFMVLVFVQTASAKVILISDIDDTIKLANIPSLVGSASYALDGESRFAGMAALYTLLSQQPQSSGIYYISNAPSWLMEKTHLDFLKTGRFPQGSYIGRTEDGPADHKLNRMREILRKEKPTQVIFFGDNTENDPLFYSMIQTEFAHQGIEFTTFIRLVTSQPVQPRQVAFVTPVEVALTLKDKNLIDHASVCWVIDNILPFIVEQRNVIDKGIVSFPSYVKCSDFKWNWDKDIQTFPTLMELKKRIQQKCGAK